uniref:Uncharacterized protein n=1 Tax=Glossina brevipalpis TaxID=37001 RepID=A0A1A9WVZ0_9MUSC
MEKGQISRTSLLSKLDDRSVHNWMRAKIATIPKFAVQAGYDTDGDPIYVGRVNRNGETFPAKVIPRKRRAYASWAGEEHVINDVELLSGHYYAWMPSIGGIIPPHAVRLGRTSEGEPLYVGRCVWRGSLTPGKIQPSHGCLYFPFGGAELRTEQYEVLVQPETWVASSGHEIVAGSVLAGKDADGDDIYVGRAYHGNNLLPAKVIPRKGCAFISYGGQEHIKHEYEVLAGNGYKWWVTDSKNCLPVGSVICGRTAEGVPLYVGRGYWGGSLTPGKVYRSHSCLYIPFEGEEVLYEQAPITQETSHNSARLEHHVALHFFINFSI